MAPPELQCSTRPTLLTSSYRVQGGLFRLFPLVRPGQEWDNQRVQFPPRLRGITAASALVLVAGCTAAPPTPNDRPSGVAARSDGSVVLVTAWCMAARTEDPQVHSYRVDGGQLGSGGTAVPRLRQQSGPVTVHQVGQANQGFEAVTNQPLPASGAADRLQRRFGTQWPGQPGLSVLGGAVHPE